MNNKNPYENQDTVDIPDFVEDKTGNSSSVDMSIFKMNDKEDDDYYDDEDDYTDELSGPSRKLNVPVIILSILVAVLLFVSIFSIIKKSSADKQISELNTTVETLKNKVSSYENEITSLNAKIAELENGGKDEKDDGKDDSEPTASDEGNYEIIVEGGINLRSEPKIGDNLVGSIPTGSFEGTGKPITDDDGNVWIKTIDGSYACMKLADGTVFIKAK